MVYIATYAALGIVFAAMMGAYVAPVIGTFFIGPEGIGIRRGAPIRSIAARLLPPRISPRISKTGPTQAS